MGRSLTLPETGVLFHLYQIGQVYEVLINLTAYRGEWEMEKWVKFSDMLNDSNVLVNIYNSDGCMLPLHRSYYMYTNEKALVFAVPMNSVFNIAYGTESLYIRLYKNAYFGSAENTGGAYMYCEGTTLTAASDLTAFLATMNAHVSDNGGYAWLYVNGNRMLSPSTLDVAAGDIVEYIYDGSVERTVQFSIANLASFTSTLDSKNKYILAYSQGSSDKYVYFEDDIDIDIFYPIRTGVYVGRYYNRNAADSHRNITYRDYAVPTTYVQSVMNALAEWVSIAGDTANMMLELKLRNSGWRRTQYYNANRTHELFKINLTKRNAVMTGVSSVMPTWSAAALEASNPMKLMGVYRENLTLALTQLGYGYNAISTVLGANPTEMEDTGDGYRVAVPPGLQTGCVVYEYDADGVMLEYHAHTSGEYYTPNNEDARIAEFICGTGTDTPWVQFGTDNVPYDPDHNNRIYLCHIVDDVPDEVWTDITTSTDFTYDTDNEVVVWAGTDTDQYLMVRSDQTFVIQDIEVTPVSGTVYFSLAENVDRGDGLENYLMRFPSARIDIFLNGRSLVRNIDYIIRFPMIYLIPKAHLAQPADTTAQWIHVRMTGFAEDLTTFDSGDDIGYTAHNCLSYGNGFNIRDDKIQRVIQGGFLKLKENMIFQEENTTLEADADNTNNGLPYQVAEILVTPSGYTTQDLNILRTAARVVDRSVESYLTTYNNTTSLGDWNVPSPYELVSPYFCHIINDLLNDLFTESELKNPMTDAEVIAALTPYTEIWEFDPLNEENGIDLTQVKVLPTQLDTVITLSSVEYYFVTRVVELYGKGYIDLDGYVST